MSCYNCENRTVGCHTICEEYLKFVQENEKRKAVIRKEKDLTYAAISFELRGRERYRRAHR